MCRSRAAALVLEVVLGLTASVVAQTGPAPSRSQVFTLDRALQYAVEHYPTVRAALEQVNGAAAGVAIAKSDFLPRFDSLWQSNRATANNIFGQVFPQAVIPAMSGPVLPSASAQSVWGSATGALLSWEPLDFGVRRARVMQAEAGVTQARAGEALTRLEVQSAVGAAFLGVVGAQRAVAAALADVERRDVLAGAVHALVAAQLRAGAEAARADAERAAAQTRLIQTQQTLALAQITIARVLGVTPGSITIDAGPPLDQLPGAELSVARAVETHPLAQAGHASIDAARAQQAVLARTGLPRLYVQSSVFARGSGAHPNGQLDGGVEGLGLDRVNWAAGVQVVFPNAFDFASLRARKAAAAASERAQAASYDETLLTLTSQQQAAAAIEQSARAIAVNTPVQLAAAQQSETQARARYTAGLASIAEVADTQSLLAQAEFQEAIARIDVWRALLGKASAQGDLTSFLNLLQASTGVR